MSVDDDLLARHRPAERLRADERAVVLDLVLERQCAASSAQPGEVIELDARVPHRAQRRRGWLPAAVAAVTVVASAAALAVWRTGDSGTTGAAGTDGPRTTCAATLPSSWSAARSADPIQVDGHDASPLSGSSTDALLLSWASSPTSVGYGLRSADGRVAHVATFARHGDSGETAATDGTHVVFSFSPTAKSFANRILLVDPATGARTELLPDAPVPSGWLVGSTAVIKDGYVYWGSVAGDDSRGVVVRYSIAEHSYRVLARTAGVPLVVSDARGVAWPGGAVYRSGLPSTLDPILDASGELVDRFVSDGGTYGWQRIAGDQTIFRWADDAGEVRTFQVTAGASHDGAFLTGIAGPFLFFDINTGGQQNYVLDTRSSALAPLDLDQSVFSYPAGRAFTQANGGEYHELDTATLPAIECG